MTYEDKIRHAITLLQSIPTEDGPIEISYSGGKDSDGYKWEYDDWRSGAEFARKTLTTDPQQCGSD